MRSSGAARLVLMVAPVRGGGDEPDEVGLRVHLEVGAGGSHRLGAARVVGDGEHLAGGAQQIELLLQVIGAAAPVGEHGEVRGVRGLAAGEDDHRLIRLDERAREVRVEAARLQVEHVVLADGRLDDAADGRRRHRAAGDHRRRGADAHVVLSWVPMMARKARRLMGSAGSKLVLGSSVMAMVCGHPATTYWSWRPGVWMSNASRGLRSEASLEKTSTLSSGLNW